MSFPIGRAGEVFTQGAAGGEQSALGQGSLVQHGTQSEAAGGGAGEAALRDSLLAAFDFGIAGQSAAAQETSQDPLQAQGHGAEAVLGQEGEAGAHLPAGTAGAEPGATAMGGAPVEGEHAEGGAQGQGGAEPQSGGQGFGGLHRSGAVRGRPAWLGGGAHPEAQKTPQSAAGQSAAGQGSGATGGGVKDSASPVPPRKFPDRLSQPGGLADADVNKRVEFGRVQQAFGTAVSVAGAAGAGSPALTQVNASVAPVQNGLNLFGSGFNAFASESKKARYSKQLDASLQADIQKFKGAVAEGQGQDAGTGTSGSSKAYPHQDTLILTRDKNGEYQYDMGKVATLAKSEDPALAGASAHAKDVLLADHIANEVAGKQRNRALYGAATSAVSVVGSGLLAGATHGGSVAVDGALRAAGYGVNGAVGMDPAAAVRTYKKGMRETKDTKIKNADLMNRYKFAQESRNGFKVAGVDVKNDQGQVIQRVPGRTVPVDAMPEEALKAARGALHDQAVQSVDKKNVFGGMLPGRLINENKTEGAKGERRTAVATHAYGIIKGHMGADDPAKIPGFVNTLEAIQAKPRDQEKILDAMVKADPQMGNAFQLFRDMGTSKSEAHGLMLKTMEIAVEKSESTDDVTARLAGIEGKDFGKMEKDEVIKPMADAGKRR